MITIGKPKLSILKILSDKWVFSVVFASLIFYAHFTLSEPFYNLQTLEFTIMKSTGNLIEQFPGEWAVFRVLYTAITGAGLWIIGFWGYRTVFEPMLKGKKNRNRLDESDITLPPLVWDAETLQMLVGLKHSKMTLEKVKDPAWITVPEKGMFQNFLISGTIGTGKTASVMYPFTKQAILFKAWDNREKAGMLVLDVKGNFYEQVLNFAAECGREEDVILIKLGGHYKYNPLHKPNMEAIDLAERSRIVMDLFSGGAKKEAFWDTKSAQMMCECIRLMRMVNGGYVTLGDDKSFNTLQQNLINKIWLRSDDKLTIETAQLLTGREEKKRVSKNISESANDTKKSRLFGRMVSDKASISESINISTQRDHVFEEKVFTQVVELFTGVCFLAHDTGNWLHPLVLLLIVCLPLLLLGLLT